ncbi:phosphatidylinositol-specific phospholipase C domain-containing protein [Bacterioplanoides sp.]|uniref:phosphatidylinositol-specific phospholipase C domain-containing protein n=1 Tax=Bacterioplanoides sp. TaxID=2066072 RepID=UPI003B5B285C
MKNAALLAASVALLTSLTSVAASKVPTEAPYEIRDGKGFPHTGVETVPSQTAPSRWMYESYHDAPQTYLRDICIPGTHDSGTYVVQPRFINVDKNISQTTQASIRQQLDGGMRQLDIRVTLFNGEYMAYHGPTIGAKAIDMFNDLKAFAAENPKEIVIIMLRLDHEISAQQRQDFMDSIFRDTIEPRVAALNGQDADVTFQRMWEQDKSFIVWDYGGVDAYPNWGHASGTPVYLSTSLPKKYFDHQVAQIKQRDPNKFFVSGLNLTPTLNAGAEEFFNGLFKGGAFSIKKLAQHVNKPALIYAKDRSAKAVGKRVNIVSGDFMEDQPAFEACMDINDRQKYFFALQSVRSGLCIGVRGDQAVNDARIELQQCNQHTITQQWDYDHTNGFLRNRADLNKCVHLPGLASSSGNELSLFECSASNETLKQAMTFDFRENIIDHRYSDVSFDSTEDRVGTSVRQWQTNGGYAQRWSRIYQTTADADATELYAAPWKDCAAENQLCDSGSDADIIVRYGHAATASFEYRRTASGKVMCNNRTLGDPKPGYAKRCAYISVSEKPEFKTLINKASGLCMDVKGGNSNPGTDVWQWPCDGGIAQLWYYNSLTKRMYSKIAHDRCLDNRGQTHNGGGLGIWRCDDPNIENLLFNWDGTYLKNIQSDQIAVDAFGTAAESVIGQWTFHGRENQQWYWGD